MKLIILAFALGIAKLSNAQILTADEMLNKTGCKDFECFNDFIIDKKFSFGEAIDQADFISYVYFSDNFIGNEGSTISVKNNAIVSFAKDKRTTRVGIRTANKNYYKSILASFKEKGFESKGTTTGKKNSVVTIYRSSNFPGVPLTVTIDKQQRDSQEWTSYCFEVEKHY